MPTFPVNNGRVVREGLVGARDADPPRSAPDAARPRERRRAAARSSRRPGTKPSSASRAGSPRSRRRHGRDAAAVFGGGSLTNEKAYLLGKFARVALGTSNIDYNGRFCMSSGAAAATMALGLDRGLPFPLEDIPQATTILLAGANIVETLPPLMQYFEAQRSRGGTVIVDRSAADADGRVGRSASGDPARHRRRARQRPASRAHPRRPRSTRRTSATARTASSRSGRSPRSTGPRRSSS